MAARIVSRGLLQSRSWAALRLGISVRGFRVTRLKQMHISSVVMDDFIDQMRIDKEKEQKEKFNKDEEEKIKAELLDTTLEEVLIQGWNKSAVAAAAARLGYPRVTAGLVSSMEEVVLHHIWKSNRQLDDWMVEEVDKLTAGGTRLPVAKFIRSCVVRRLSYNIPLLKAGLWAQGMAMVAQPAWAGSGLELAQEVCDDIWYRAGDKSADMNWYSKRITLGMVMTATEVFMVQDNSVDYRDTWDFLDRRLDDLTLMPSLSKVPSDIKGVLEGTLLTAKILAGVQK